MLNVNIDIDPIIEQKLNAKGIYSKSDITSYIQGLLEKDTQEVEKPKFKSFREVSQH